MFRSLLRFSIRDVLLLTLAVALAIGWWIDHSRRRGMQAELDTVKAHLESMKSVMAREGYEIVFLPDCVVLKRTHMPGLPGYGPHSPGGEMPEMTDQDGSALPGPGLPGPASLSD